MEALEVVLEQKRTDFYKDLTALSKFDEKKVECSENQNIDSFKLLNDLGFINSSVIKRRNEIISKNRNFIEAVKQASLSLLFIKEASEYFGEGTILIKRDDFVYLIQKYGLVCGNFSDYLGIVPDKNLLEIEEAKKKIDNLRSNKDGDCYKCIRDAYNKEVRVISNIEMDWKDEDTRYHLNKSTKRYLNSFPYVLLNGSFYGSSEVRDYLLDYIPENELNKIRGLQTTLSMVENGMFICAPRKDMKNAERKITFRAAPKDPFICSLVPYGVVIYSRWSKEAQDATLTKYDKLFARMREA